MYIWQYSQEKLNDFHVWLNNRIPGIKFTLKSSMHSTEFLDLFIYHKNNKLHTRTYSKPCDVHVFLVPSSCHPSHTLRNIPYSTALRIYKNTSELAEFHKSKEEYSNLLKARGYSIDIITESFRKVESNPRENYFLTGFSKKSKQEDNHVIPLVTDFNPELPNIGRVLNLHKHILRLDPDLCKAIDPDGIFASFRGNKTIHDKLVHSRLPSLEDSSYEKEPGDEVQPIGGCKKCNAKRCDFCNNFLKQTNTAYSYHTNSIFNINQNFNCESKNVVYVINDLICKISSVDLKPFIL